MSVEFEIENGELILKHDGSPNDVSTVAAIARAVALMSKNDDSYTSGAYGEDVDPDAAELEDARDEEDDEEDDETAGRERARRLQRDPAALAAASVGERTEKRSETMTTDEMIESIRKSGCAIAILKRFVDEGKDAWTEFQITKILSDHWGADFAKNLTAQTPDGLIARQALQKAKYDGWGVGATA
jgi:hypothetical protein